MGVWKHLAKRGVFLAVTLIVAMYLVVLIANAGGLLMADTCGLEFNHDPSAVIATDSPKQAHYYPGKCGVENALYGKIEECIDAAVSGTWKGELR